MRIDVHFSDLTEDQANNLFASLRCDYNGPAPIVEPAPELVAAVPVAESLTIDPPITRKRGRLAKAKDHGTPSRSEPASTSAGSSYVEPAGESAAGTSTPTLDDVRAALAGLMSRKGAEACTAVLKSFDVPRISWLLAEQYGKFIAACNAA